MAKAVARIFRTTNPMGWCYTFDRADVADGAIDNFSTAANPNAALDALKPIIGAMPGQISTFTINVETFEP